MVLEKIVPRCPLPISLFTSHSQGDAFLFVLSSIYSIGIFLAGRKCTELVVISSS